VGGRSGAGRHTLIVSSTSAPEPGHSPAGRAASNCGVSPQSLPWPRLPSWRVALEANGGHSQEGLSASVPCQGEERHAPLAVYNDHVPRGRHRSRVSQLSRRWREAWCQGPRASATQFIASHTRHSAHCHRHRPRTAQPPLVIDRASCVPCQPQTLSPRSQRSLTALGGSTPP